MISISKPVRRRSYRGRFFAVTAVLSLSATVAMAQLASHSREWPSTDFSTAIIDLSEILSGGVPKDGIPAIDNPQFVSIGEASAWLDSKEPVIVLDILGKARAYPLQILIWHEIVNDELNGRFIAVTFCPLCNAAIVFDRNLDGAILDFGTTGKLRNSDLVMYDRQSESWWQQITGRGLVGDYAGITLSRLAAQIVSFDEFKTAYPLAQVLSRETGFRRNYGVNPYRGYDHIDNIPFLLKDPADPRLRAMERVVNISVNGQHKVYPFSAFEREPVINDAFGGIPVVIFSKDDAVSALDQASIAGSRVIPSATVFRRQHDDQLLTFEQRNGGFFDLQTGSEWNLFGQAIDGPLQGYKLSAVDSGLHFAFAWLAFHPESEIYPSQ